MRFASISLAVIGIAAQAAAIDPLVVKGNKWFNKKSGDEFFIKGVAYQPDITSTEKVRDPLTNESGCSRDLAFLKDLGVNAIRVYQTEPFGDHDACMKMLSDAGIYVMLDLGTPTETINRDSPEYDAGLLGYYQRKVDAFSKYDNVFAFLAGNEVTNAANNTDASAFVKASLRDVKAYIKDKKLAIPVGYASNDDADIRWQLQTYFDCGNADDQADFYGVNLYEWCGEDATYESSGYSSVVKNFTNWDVPVVLTEYGCNAIRPRTFPEVKAIYGDKMSDVFSGGFVYEYVEEPNNYGLVKISGDKGSKTEDFDNFKKALKAVDPKGTTMDSYKDSNKQQACPKVDKNNNWLASSTLPPTPSNATCDCMMKTLSCVTKLTAEPSGDDAKEEFGKQIGAIFNYVCSRIDCGAVSANGTKGEYGKYSFCSATQRASWVLNAWYIESGKKKDSCDFKGYGKTVKPESSSDSKCASSNSTTSSDSSSSSDDKSKSGDNSDDSAAPAASAVFGSAVVAVVVAVLF